MVMEGKKRWCAGLTRETNNKTVRRESTIISRHIHTTNLEKFIQSTKRCSLEGNTSCQKGVKRVVIVVEISIVVSFKYVIPKSIHNLYCL